MRIRTYRSIARAVTGVVGVAGGILSPAGAAPPHRAEPVQPKQSQAARGTKQVLFPDQMSDKARASYLEVLNGALALVLPIDPQAAQTFQKSNVVIEVVPSVAAKLEEVSPGLTAHFKCVDATSMMARDPTSGRTEFRLLIEVAAVSTADGKQIDWGRLMNLLIHEMGNIDRMSRLPKTSQAPTRISSREYLEGENAGFERSIGNLHKLLSNPHVLNIQPKSFSQRIIAQLKQQLVQDQISLKEIKRQLALNPSHL